MQVITHEEALGLLEYGPLIDFFEERHRLTAAEVGDVYTGDGRGNGLLSRTGFAAGSGLGAKLASIFPGNRDLPTVHTVYAVFNPVTGQEEAIIIGNALTWFKTACDSALGARHLARPDSRRLLMVGAGAMAPHLIKAHLAARPALEKVAVWNRTPARAQRLVGELASENLPADITVAADLEGEAGAADIISCATMTVQPLIKGEWLSPGTHLDLVGSYLPHMREADDAAVAGADIYVDSRDSATETGELAIPLAAGVITPEDILADHYQLAAGTAPGRTDPYRITLFKNGGGGHLDLMSAQYLITRL